MTPTEEVPCASFLAMTFGATFPEITGPPEPPINDHARILPPLEPPSTGIFPPCSIIGNLMRPPSTHTICATQLDLHAKQDVDSTLALLPYQIPSILDSVTRVVCSLRVCGVCGKDMTSVKILRIAKSNGKLIDSGSNVCVTRDLTILLDVSDITPIDISVALDGTSTSLDDRITKRGLLPLTLSDGSVYYQTCFYCANMVETIISPAAILASSDVFYYWYQEGCKDPTAPGCIWFTSKDGILSMFFTLEYRKGLYYCSSDIFTVNQDTPVRVICHRTTTPTLTDINHTPSEFVPTSLARQVESEVWLTCLGSPGDSQLDLYPGHNIGTPPVFKYHPFRLIDFKEQAYIQKQAAQRVGERIPRCGAEFFMNFRFIWASTSGYKHPNKHTDRIVTSYGGYSSHLVIVDSTSRRVWAFLTKSKEPPLDIISAFMKKFGIGNGVVRTD